MRSIVWNIVTLATVLVTLSITPSSQVPQPAREEVGPVWDVITECSIPNESRKGVCRTPTECPAYSTINNAQDVSSVGRLSFLKQIQCNATGNVGVCCPRTKRYQSPTLNESVPKKNRTKSTRVHSRFGDDEICGYQSFVPKIRGGEIANIDEFPWMAMLLYELKESKMIVHGCGGALISKNFVITAAHCVTGKDYDNKGPLKFVRLREYNVFDDPDCVIDQNFKDCSEEKIDAEPLQIIVHPNYDPNFRHKYHDLALIEIGPVPFYTDFLRHICLPEPDLDNGAAPGKKFSVSGWGRTDIFRQQLGNNALSPIKLKVILPYVEPEHCRRVFRAQQLEIGPGQLCAGGEKAKDTCGGDSGSPLMFYDNKAGAWVLTGIVSLGVRAETDVLGKLLIKAVSSAGQTVPTVSSPSSKKASVSTAVTADISSDCLVVPVSVATSIDQVTSSIASTSSKASATTVLTGSVDDSSVITAKTIDSVAPPIASESRTVSRNLSPASVYVPPVITVVSADRVAFSKTSRSEAKVAEVLTGSVEVSPVVYRTQSPNQTISPTQPSSSKSSSTKVFTDSGNFSTVAAATSDDREATAIVPEPRSIELPSFSIIDRVTSAEGNYINPANFQKKLDENVNKLEESEEHPVQYQISADLLRSLLYGTITGPQPSPAPYAESASTPCCKVPSNLAGCVNNNIAPAEQTSRFNPAHKDNSKQEVADFAENPPVEAEVSVSEIVSQSGHSISLDWLRTVLDGIVIRSETLTTSDSSSINVPVVQAPPYISTSPIVLEQTVEESGLQVTNVDQSVASAPSYSAVPPGSVIPQLVQGSVVQTSCESETDIDSENQEEPPRTFKNAISSNHFSPAVLLKLLTGTTIGDKIIPNAETLELTEASKKLVTDVVARYHLAKNRKSSFEVLNEYAEVIVKTFKKEKKETYCAHRKGKNPGGKLYSRINYLSQAERNREREEDDHINRLGQPATFTQEVNPEALKAISWLQLNRAPWSSVLVQWENSFSERCRDLKKPNKFPLILNTYPHLVDEPGFQLLDIDFRLLGYGDPAAGERKWRTLIDDITTYIAKHAKDPSAKELLQLLRNPDHGIDARLCATLLGLNTVLIPVKAAKGFKPTVITAQNDTFWLCVDENAARSKLEAERGIWNMQGLPEIPKLIVFGTSIETVSSTCVVTYKDIEYKLPSVSRGVDVLLKLILVFDLPISRVSKLVWLFIQEFVYGVDAGYKYVNVTKLTEFLEKKQTC